MEEGRGCKYTVVFIQVISEDTAETLKSIKLVAYAIYMLCCTPVCSVSAVAFENQLTWIILSRNKDV